MPEVASVRDLFALTDAARPRVVDIAPSVPRSLPPPAAIAPVEIPVALPSLIGLTEQRSGAVVERLAVFAVNDEPVIARVGTTVLDRLRVTAIGADAVELMDVRSGATHVVVLR